MVQCKVDQVSTVTMDKQVDGNYYFIFFWGSIFFFFALTVNIVCEFHELRQEFAL